MENLAGDNYEDLTPSQKNAIEKIQKTHGVHGDFAPNVIKNHNMRFLQSGRVMYFIQRHVKGGENTILASIPVSSAYCIGKRGKIEEVKYL